MRKGLLVVLAVVAFVGVQANMVLAKGIADNGPGCGLGKEVWRDSSIADTWGAQMLISTTNNPFIPLQAFAITSQTLGCHNSGKFWAAAEKANMFAAINFENLSQEMAQGGGEHLASMATLMGVPTEHQGEFFGMTQERYTTLVKAGEASPVAMVKALNEAAASYPTLAKVASK